MGRLNYTREATAGLKKVAGESATEALSVALRLLWAGRLMEDLLERAAVAGGLRRRGDYEVLTVLLRSEGTPPTPAEVAAQLSASASGMTSKLDRLEAGGLIERQPDKKDRRLIRIALTEQGLRTARSALAVTMDLYDSIFEPLTEEERDSFDEGLRILLPRLDELSTIRDPWAKR